MILYVYEGEPHRGTHGQALVRKALFLYAQATGAPLAACTAASAPILRGRQGKPYFADQPFEFSVSHTGKLWCCLMSDKSEGPVGLDVQAVRPVKGREIARRFFTAEEAQYTEGCGEADFFDIWTRKEAYVKYLGTGMAEGLATFSVLGKSGPATGMKNIFFTEIKIRNDIKCMACTEKKRRIWTAEIK